MAGMNEYVTMCIRMRLQAQILHAHGIAAPRCVFLLLHHLH